MIYYSSTGWSGGAKVLGKLSVPGRPTRLAGWSGGAMVLDNFQCRGVLQF